MSNGSSVVEMEMSDFMLIRMKSVQQILRADGNIFQDLFIQLKTIIVMHQTYKYKRFRWINTG